MNEVAIKKRSYFYYTKQKGAIITLLLSAILCSALSEHTGFVQIAGLLFIITSFHAAELYEAKKTKTFYFYAYSLTSFILLAIFALAHPNPYLSLSLSSLTAFVFLLTPSKMHVFKHKTAFLALVYSGSFCYIGNQPAFLIAHLFLFYIYLYAAIALIHWKMKKISWKQYQWIHFSFCFILLAIAFYYSNLLPAILACIIIVKYFITSIYMQKFKSYSLKKIGIWELSCSVITILLFYSHIL